MLRAPAMRDSVSPRATRTSPPLSALAAAAGAGRGDAAGGDAGRGAGARGAAASGAGAAAGAAGGGASGLVSAGAGVITGEAAGGALGRSCGGSNSMVYSRTSRPLAQVASTMRSTKGSSTARSLRTCSTWRPSGGHQLTCAGGQHGVVVDARAAVDLGRRHAQTQRTRLLRRDAGDLDLGPQRLAQRRLHRQPAQPQGPGLGAPRQAAARPRRAAQSAVERAVVFER
jgi:hypothetical protein